MVVRGYKLYRQRKEEAEWRAEQLALGNLDAEDEDGELICPEVPARLRDAADSSDDEDVDEPPPPRDDDNDDDDGDDANADPNAPKAT